MTTYDYNNIDFNSSLQEDKSDEMPECAEKCLNRMLLNLKKSCFNQEICVSLKKDFISFINFLSREYNDFDITPEIKSCIESIKYVIDDNNLIKAEKELQKLLKMLRPFNFEELFCLMEKTKQSEAKIKDKEVVLLIGRTGSGKSTTLHCLSGSKFRKIESKDHYEPYDFPIDLLEQVKTSTSANSETRYILPIEIDLRNSINREGSIFLCDTPGFNDTAGSEVDIANMYGLFEAIKKCKSVRLVVFISSKSLGDRYEGIIEMAELLHQMIPDIEYHLTSIAYVFTKFQSVENVKHALEEALKKKDIQDNTILEIIENMNNSPILIDPLNSESAKNALKTIVKLKGIMYPDEIFKSITNSKAYDCLFEQINLHERAIDSALKKEKFDLICFKLTQLRKIKSYLEIDSASDRLFSKLDNYFKELYMTCWSKIKNWFEDNLNILSQAQIDEIKDTIQKLQLAKNLISTHIDSQFDYVSDLYNEIGQQCENLFNKFQECQCESKDLQEVIHYLENIKIICFGFSGERLHELFLKTRQLVEYKFEAKKSLLENFINDQVFEFEKFAEVLSECKSLKNYYLKYFDGKDEWDIEKKFNSVCMLIKEYFEVQKEKIIKKLEFGEQNEKDSIESLVNLIENLNKSLNCAKLCTLIDKEDLKTIMKSLNDFIFKKISSIYIKLESLLSQSNLDKTLMDAIEVKYYEIKKWREISGPASLAFQEIRQKIEFFFLSTNKKKLDDFFGSFNNYVDNESIEPIKLYFEILKNSQWLNEIKENLYADLFGRIDDYLLTRFEEMGRTYNKLTISVENYKNIKEANQIFVRMERFGPFLTSDHEIWTLVRSVVDNFKQKMEEALSIIKKEINKEILKKENLKCSFLHSAIKFVDEAITNSIYVINLNELEVLKCSITDFLIYYHNLVCAEFEENFRSIKDSEFDANLQNIITEKSSKMVFRLKEFKIMKKSYSSLYDLVNSHEDLVEKWRNSLVAYSSELDKSMEFSRSNQQDRELDTKILIAKVMSKFDDYLDAKKKNIFNELYIKYKIESQEETISLTKRIIDLLQRNDFTTVQGVLTRLNEMKISDMNLNDIRNSINSAIEKLIENVESAERKITKDLDQESVEYFVKSLKILKKVKNEILDFPSDERETISNNYNKVLDKQKPITVTDFLKKIDSNLLTKLKSYLESIQNSIKMDYFIEAENRRDRFDQVRTVLADHVSDFFKIQQLFDSIEQELKQIVKSLIERYTKMPIEDYKSNYPKDFFQKLEEIKTIKKEYTYAYFTIEEIIITNIKNYMNTPQERTLQERLDYVESLLWYLPKNVNDRLSSDITRKKKENDEHKSKFEKDLMTSLNNHDLDKVLVIKKSLTPDTKDLSAFFDTKLSDYLQSKICEIKSDLENVGVEQAVEKLEKLNKYVGKMRDEKISQEILSCGIKDKLLQKFESIKSVVKIIKSDDDDLSNVSQNIEEFFICSSIFMDNLFKDLFMDDSKRETVTTEINELIDYFKNNRLEFDKGLDQAKIDQVIRCLKNSLKCDLIAKTAKNKLKKSQLKFNVTEYSTNCLIRALNEKVQLIVHEILNTNFKDNEKFKYEKDRTEIYKNIYLKSKFLKDLKESIEVKEMFEKLDLKSFSKLEENEKKVSDFLNINVVEILDNILKIIDSPIFMKSDIKILKFNYENFVSFKKAFVGGLTRSSSCLNEIQNRLIDKCFSISLQVNPSPANMETTVNSLINLKLISDNLTSLKVNNIDNLIETSLKEFQKKNGNSEIINLASHLEGLETGLLILRDYQIFKSAMIRILADKTSKHDINYVLESLKGDAVFKDQLKKRYQEFDIEYQNLIKYYILSISNEKSLNNLINITKNILNLKKKEKKFGSKIKSVVPKLVAHIFAVWTLKNTQHFNEIKELSNKEAYLLKPHPAQVIAIFRLLGIGYDKSYLGKALEMLVWDTDLPNNFVQVGTGEGKSVILAVVAIVMALAGLEVSCVCFSEYLSKRDYNDFQQLFVCMGVEKKIFYGTFNQVCESFLNQNYDIRERVLSLIKSNTLSTAESENKTQTPKILLIDEVDVFFNQDFSGNLYVPSARLKDPSITKLIDLIWSKKKSINYHSLKKTIEYDEVKDKFPKWIGLIDEALKDVLFDLKNFESHEYKIFDNRIAYKEQDGVQNNIVYGYKTLFAYYQEHERGKINKKSLNENISLNIYCGCFSYCEIPKKFQYILGVTGTLEKLSSTHKTIISDMYKIKFSTYIPSIYGDRNLVFHNEADTLIATKADFFLKLKHEIDKRICGTVNVNVKRAVLVFFDKIETLNSFHASPLMKTYIADDDVGILKEDTTLNDKICMIKKATTSGKITLLTRSFGRGIDFVCTSRSMLINGGVHVIQTFFSDDPSEEIQIMGRTARQGEPGSYSLVLMDEDLEKFFGTSYKVDLENMLQNSLVYKSLNEQRNRCFDKQTESIQKAIQNVQSDHKISENFLDELFKENLDYVKNFLIEKNKGSVLEIKRSKTICLMDATGSMGHLLDQVKNTICVMFDRTIRVLEQNDLPIDSFEIQLAVYRDYDLLDNVLQVSGWEIKPLNLRDFMSTVVARGGGDYEEAIEIGLWHVNQEQSKLKHPDRISQVILIGDAPAKSEEMIKKYRRLNGGEDFWEKTIFRSPTYYKKELEIIKSYSIPIHTFYIEKGPEECFAEIAAETGGKTGFLDVKSSNGSDQLIDLITPLILSDVGTLNGGIGSRLVEDYKKKYSKSYY
ncbi:unnamed protein product [Brachionus calyciflorus]|uniref:SecA family profile domain-containing protein n=1 Tax=Brachionus calyciflorus TaxID=104777 RepID=A0A814CLE3_9BILA|nr:unnamed protein product [Brachionus calyciflorus]